MKCIDDGVIKEIPFGHKLVGHRYDDIYISVRELKREFRDHLWTSDDLMHYLIQLQLTVRP